MHVTTGLAALLLLLSVGTPSVAGNWHGRAGFTMDADYSGNVFLDNAATQSDLILRARPTFSLNREGGMASVDVRYAPELRHYVNGTQSDQIKHFLNATGDTLLVEDRFGVRATATAGQSFIDPRARYTNDGLTNPNNVTDTYTLRVTPYSVPIRLKNYAILAADITGDLVNYSNSDIQRQTSREASIRLTSGTYFSRFDWDLSTRKRLTSYENGGSDQVFGNFRANGGYRINRIWRVGATLGQDNNDFQANRDTNGMFWDLNATWTPTPRTSLLFGYGERFNDTNYQFSLSHRHKHSQWTGRYYRDLSTASDELLNRQLFPLEDEFGNPIENPTDDPDSVGIIPGGPALDQTVYILERFNLGYSWSLRRTSVNVNLGYTRRDNLQTDEDSEDVQLRMSLNRTLGPRSSVTLGGGWLDHTDQRAETGNYTQYSADLGYSYRLSEETSIRTSYRYTTRDAANGDDFSEDRISFSVVNNMQ